MKSNFGKRAQMTTGAMLIIGAIALVLFWTQTTIIQDFLDTPTGGDGNGEVEPGRCPSSGLTEVTINTQEALASTATDSTHDYYVFDKDGTFITTANSGSNGQSVFNVGCSEGRRYDVLVVNETAVSGFYPQTIEIDASGPTDTHNLKTYEYGNIDLISVASDTDPAGTTNISSAI